MPNIIPFLLMVVEVWYRGNCQKLKNPVEQCEVVPFHRSCHVLVMAIGLWICKVLFLLLVRPSWLAYSLPHWRGGLECKHPLPQQNLPVFFQHLIGSNFIYFLLKKFPPFLDSRLLVLLPLLSSRMERLCTPVGHCHSSLIHC